MAAAKKHGVPAAIVGGAVGSVLLNQSPLGNAAASLYLSHGEVLVRHDHYKRRWMDGWMVVEDLGWWVLAMVFGFFFSRGGSHLRELAGRYSNCSELVCGEGRGQWTCGRHIKRKIKRERERGGGGGGGLYRQV